MRNRNRLMKRWKIATIITSNAQNWKARKASLLSKWALTVNVRVQEESWRHQKLSTPKNSQVPSRVKSMISAKSNLWNTKSQLPSTAMGKDKRQIEKKAQAKYITFRHRKDLHPVNLHLTDPHLTNPQATDRHLTNRAQRLWTTSWWWKYQLWKVNWTHWKWRKNWKSSKVAGTRL